MKELQGKIAIVTGASRSGGIGTAICRTLANAGADIFFTHWSRYDETDGNGAEKEWAATLCGELGNMGVRSAHMEADLSDPGTPARIMNRVEEALGAASVLIHNATHCAATDFRGLDALQLDLHYEVNNRGTILLSTEFAKSFERKLAGHRQGRIVHLVSKGNDPHNLAYIATKGALIAITEPLAVALAPLGITVNSIDPGPTDSGWMSGELKAKLLPLFPMGRIGLPEDAAKLVKFLASDESHWITGQLIKSEGGFMGK